MTLDYINGRAVKSDIRQWIRFNTPVRMVTYSERSGKFTVTVDHRQENRMYSEDFDNVIVASGHFSVPNMPAFEGIEQFPGRVLHAHDFRDAIEFKVSPSGQCPVSEKFCSCRMQCHCNFCTALHLDTLFCQNKEHLTEF